MLIPNLHTVLRIESKKKDNEKDAFFFHIYKRSNARKLQTCLPPDLQSSGSSWWGGEVRRILSGKCCEQAGEKAGRRCLTVYAAGRIGAGQQSAELRELHCPISASRHCHDLPPENQEPCCCKLPSLFLSDLLAGVPWQMPQPSSQLSHVLYPFPRGPLSQQATPTPQQHASRRGTITVLENTTGKVGWSSTLNILC